MKNILYLLFFITVSYKVTAQITYIPDQGFEQALIDLEIDSDGIINGQVLTSDVENVTELIIANGGIIYSLTGIQDFTSLEKLVVNFTWITELDVSENLQLKELDCSSNELTSIDVSSNPLLEILRVGNIGGDVGPFNMIEEIDLSNNPNLYILDAQDMSWPLKRINLKNGNNNFDMTIDIGVYPWIDWNDPDYDPYEIYNTICIEVDDADLALNNEFPYSDWIITNPHTAYIFTDDMVQCSLSTQSFAQNKISIYPNPVSDMLYFETAGVTIEKVMVFDLSGRKILEQNQVSTISVSDLQKGSYILKIFSDKGVQTEKVVVR